MSIKVLVGNRWFIQMGDWRKLKVGTLYRGVAKAKWGRNAETLTWMGNLYYPWSLPDPIERTVGRKHGLLFRKWSYTEKHRQSQIGVGSERNRRVAAQNIFPSSFLFSYWANQVWTEVKGSWLCSHLVKAMVFPVVMYGCESWTVKKAERRKIDAFGL